MKVLLSIFILLQICLSQAFNPLTTKDVNKVDSDKCFCKLEGKIDDCSCNVDTVDYFNNMKIFPRLQSLLQKDYFRYFKYNAKKPCPFWNNADGLCKYKSCGVQACTPDEIPQGLKSENKDCDANDSEQYIKLNNQVDATISDEALADLISWKAFDDSQSQFCELDPEDNCSDCDYVDLTRNPERFTGYSGESAHRVWRAIYEENCFRPSSVKSTHFSSAFLPQVLEGMCLEKRAFYRAISGLHASITVHLTSQHPEGTEDSKSNNLFPGKSWNYPTPNHYVEKNLRIILPLRFYV